MAGAGELREGAPCDRGDYPSGRHFARCHAREGRLCGGGYGRAARGSRRTWDLIDAVDVYTIYPLAEILEEILLPTMEAARRHGVCWHYARPPVVDIDFEMDLHGVVTQRIV